MNEIRIHFSLTFQFWILTYSDPVEGRLSSSCGSCSLLRLELHLSCGQTDIHVLSHSGDDSMIAAQREEESTERARTWGKTKPNDSDYFHPIKHGFSPWLYLAVTWGALKNPDALCPTPNVLLQLAWGGA